MELLLIYLASPTPNAETKLDSQNVPVDLECVNLVETVELCLAKHAVLTQIVLILRHFRTMRLYVRMKDAIAEIWKRLMKLLVDVSDWLDQCVEVDIFAWKVLLAKDLIALTEHAVAQDHLRQHLTGDAVHSNVQMFNISSPVCLAC